MPRSRSSRSSSCAEMSPHVTHSSSSSEMSPRTTRSCSSSNMSSYATRSKMSSERPSAMSLLKGGRTPSSVAESENILDLCSADEVDDLSDTGSDFEETLKKRPRSIHKLSRPGTVATKRPRRAVEKVTSVSHGSDGDLFEAIRQGKSAIQILVDEWLDSYKQNRESALLELINFLMQACGCKGVVTQEMLEHMQNADIIRKMTEEFDEDTADYPLSLSTQPWKKFRLNFGEYLDTLVNRCQYSIIYDELLMDALISLLTGMSDSQVRAFRHTSTFSAMKLMTGLVKVARDLSVHLNTCQRQYDVERAKNPEKRALERLETLQEKRRELQENLEEIGNMMNGIFKGVFVHRYRDTVPDIRAICMEEIGVWMKTHSQSFLNDSYLKYVGWTLHDKQGNVRLQCVRSLQGLYVVPEFVVKMELFTSRFKDRMVSMAKDKEQQVAVEVIKLLGLLSQNMEDLLSKEDCETVYPLVFSASRALSSAAGAFLYQRLLCTKETRTSPKERSRRGTNAAFFRLLVSFFIESKVYQTAVSCTHLQLSYLLNPLQVCLEKGLKGILHEHAAYLVDSLWETAGVQLRDWECQTDLLLVEETGLDDTQESALIEILVSSMRQAVEGTSPVGRVPGKKALSVRDKKTQSDDKVRLTRHMSLVLPHLLAKFSADAEKMTSLLRVIQFLEMEIYCTERLEKHFDILLSQVQEILEKHTEPDVLEGCSRALYVLCNRDLTLYKHADIARSHLVDQLTDHFLQQVPDILQATDLDEDEVYNIAATMKRISALYSAHDLSRWELFDPCSRILRKAIDTGEVPEQIVLPALTCGHFALLWELSGCSSHKTPQDKLASLRKKLFSFCDMCQSCLSDLHISVREQAFILLSDILVIFGGHMVKGERSHLQSLVYRPELSLQAELAGFLLDHVFKDPEEEEEEDKSHLLLERRNLLAGYCKLILYSALQLRSASDIFRHYIKFYKDYGDIIKETLHRTRSINKEESTKTVLLSLTQAYTGLCQEGGSPPLRSSRPFLEIRDLARRLALLFGPDQMRNRQDVVLLHKEGIKFSLRNPETSEWSSQNLPFLDVLSEFSPRLLRQDKKALLRYLDQICEQRLPLQQEDDAELCAPLQAYKRSLSTDGDSSPAPQGQVSAQRDGARRRSDTQGREVPPPHKRRKSSIDTVDISSVIMEEDGRKRLPLMSSTLLKEKPAPPTQGRDEEEGGSESDFEPSRFSIRRPLGTPSSFRSLRPRTGTPATLSSSLHRMSLMEEEEEEEIVIEDVESSERSAGEDELPDLLDSAILDSEDDL